MKRNFSAGRGQVLIIFVFALIGLIGVTGLAIDGGNIYSNRRHAQNAADAAALAAAVVKVNSEDAGLTGCAVLTTSCGSQVALTALNMANTNGFTNNITDSTVEVFIPPIDPPYSNCGSYSFNCNDYVQVVIHTNVDTFFAKVLGIGQLHNRVQAVALAKSSDVAVVFAANFETEGADLPHIDLIGGQNKLIDYFVNSLVISVPATLIPISVAVLAAYGFAWVSFRGRNVLFIAVFALQVVPLQIALIPLLKAYVDTGVNGSFWTLWLSHTIFALPLAVFLLHNFMRDIPSSLIEAARVDGAGHVKIFFRIILPLLTPAIASFGIFQFLWVWNDLLVSLTMTGATPNVAPLTVRVANMAGTRGGDWEILTAGAFISMAIPVLVFPFLQRFFVRGLLAGSVKG